MIRSLPLRMAFVAAIGTAGLFGVPAIAAGGSDPVEFNRDIRRILSENCFQCHGPDAAQTGGRRALRLDLPEAALARKGDRAAIVPGNPGASEMLRRIRSEDPDDRMPPPESGKILEPAEVALIEQWIREGAVYSAHWSYVPPRRPVPPPVGAAGWVRNPVDRFILARMEREGFAPAPEADALTLVRRAALDLTGLPPTLDEVDLVIADHEPEAYERWVDRLLKKEVYGEHWARLWLDLARYADSSGYADDPPRTIWAFRDYVIRSFNANKPFDQFTLEQLAGDLLPDAGDEEFIATAFHRNTLTNNEGGTNDEEYRNVAVVDRVNTTMAVWMGTTMACAQCHNHKYDPVTQEEYFRLFAILNNTEDADRGDESPVHPLFTPEQQQQRQAWEAEIASIERELTTRTPQLDRDQAAWEGQFESPISWEPLRPDRVVSEAGAPVTLEEEGTARFARGGTKDTYTLEFPPSEGGPITGIRLNVLPEPGPPGQGVGHAGGNFVLSRVQAAVASAISTPASGRFLRIELPGRDRILSLAEVQVFSGTDNVAPGGQARQSSTAFDGPARLAIDGNTDGNFGGARSTTHTETSADPWWEVDLTTGRMVDRVVVWNRTDGFSDRLAGFRVLLLDEHRQTVWESTETAAPEPQVVLHPNETVRQILFQAAAADYSEDGFDAGLVVNNPDPAVRGWAVAPRLGEPHWLHLVPAAPVIVGPGSKLVLRLEHQSRVDHATLARIRLERTSDDRSLAFAWTPPAVFAALKVPSESRTAEQREAIGRHYLSIAPALEDRRLRLAERRRQVAALKPYTTVPIFRELRGEQRRSTRLQRRGNFLDLGPEVVAALPSAWAPATGTNAVDRLTLARWLVDAGNPLTARVVANRLWEAVFGLGLVRTSEEFGSQGEPPSHPELLDWLAVELMETGWDLKQMLRLLVTSATYRQSSRVTPELEARDPDNRLLARGPRNRLSAEMIRDQALAVGGLLSPRMYGPPVKPPQPRLGLSAAFGSGTDWEPSMGEDRYRRALYTTWRRSNPYPSMATFDAPNREVCLVRRERSNTPLQALVTLNDPVYLEAAQALARRMASAGGSAADKARHGFRLCLARPPGDGELAGLLALHERTRERFESAPDQAKILSTRPLGDAPEGTDLADLAAWTVVGNVLLNLDETLMPR